MLDIRIPDRVSLPQRIARLAFSFSHSARALCAMAVQGVTDCISPLGFESASLVRAYPRSLCTAKQTVILPHSSAEYGIIQAYKEPTRCLTSRRHGRYCSGVTTMESIPRTSGIYQILCIPTGKVYIGSAVNLYKRKHVHWAMLHGGYHHNDYLQKAWDKHGESSFVFSVIELVLLSFVTDREQFWMNKLDTCNRRKGYNIQPTAGSAYGLKRSPETRAKMSASQKGKPRNPLSTEAQARATLSHCKFWVVTDPDGNEYQVRNLKSFCQEHGLARTTMFRIANGLYDNFNGWRCRYRH